MGISKRRFVTAGLAATAMPLFAACGWRSAVTAPTAAGTIDVHVHLFNGRDVPAKGVLRDVILRDPHVPPTQSKKLNVLLALLIDLLVTGTPTARKELAALLASRSALGGDAALVQDRQRVADAILRLAGRRERSKASDAVPPSDIAAFLAELQAGLPATMRLNSGTAPPEAELRRTASALADAIFAPVLVPRDPTLARAIRRNDSDLYLTIRWAALLTRHRQDILAEYLRLYGHDGATGPGIRTLCPAIVDFELWFRELDRVSPIGDQISVTSALARATQDAVLLGFAPFCPLRAATMPHTHPDHPLNRLRHAVGDEGFVGVKLYPPLGFVPLGNGGERPVEGTAVPAPDGARLDAELRRLYQWCADQGVPILAHGGNSMGRSICTGLFASPRRWKAVLAQYPRLRVSLAHFGGFDIGKPPPSEVPAPNCPDPDGQNWEDIIADLVPDDRGLYADLSFWSEAQDSADRARVLDNLRRQLLAQPEMKRRLLYGSDFHLLARTPHHPSYVGDVQSALSAAGLSVPEVAAVEHDNALRFLGLQPGSQRVGDLDRFFAAHDGWAAFRKTIT